MSIALIVLAAGRGTRMRSDLPKVLHEVAGAPLLSHALAAGEALAPERTVVVAGEGADLVRMATLVEAPDADVVIQEERRGTAHAVAQAREALAGLPVATRSCSTATRRSSGPTRSAAWPRRARAAPTSSCSASRPRTRGATAA